MFKKWIPLLIILLVAIVFFLFELNEYTTFESLKSHEKQLMELISAHPILAPLIYMLLYMLAVICLLPIGQYLSLAGGFFFTHPFSEIYILIGATLGACAVYLLAKGPLHDLFLKKAGPRLTNLKTNFQKNNVRYLLSLRIMPFSPFWLVNLGCAFLGVRFWTFAWTTFVGIIPSTIILSEIGTKLGKIFRSGGEYTITSILNWPMILMLLALALLVALPVFFKKKSK